MDSDTDSDSDYDSYDTSRPNSALKISHVGSSGVQESAASLMMRRDGSQFTSQSTQSPSSSSEEEDVEERGSDQSDSNPESPEYHSSSNPFQQYSYCQSVSSSESDEEPGQDGLLSKQVDKKTRKRTPPSSPEGSSSSSVEDSDKHVDKKPHIEKEKDKKTRKRTPPSSPEGSSSSSVEDSDKHVVKKPHIETEPDHEYSDFAKKMMTMMGHEPGTGLGRTGEGIVEPIKASMQRGRAGLGTEKVPELTQGGAKWTPKEVSCQEFPEWIDSCSLDPPPESKEGLDTWCKIGERKSTIDDETLFCDEKVLKQILKNKTVFDGFDRKAFLDARDRANPFELIKGIIFQNRAAMKMANLDAVFGFMFTGMRDKSGKKITETNELLYFADICAGPGGFTEYVLYRTKWHAKGFGFTLKDPPDGSDFKLDEFHSSDSETFEPYYGHKKDGDITNTENLTSLQERVFEATDNLGVHFVMGDGGISVEGEENIQELLTKQLVMCQFACALSILREGGHFVCKLFDMYTPFLVGLIYLLYCCFEKICIIKPVTSRPANSERYVVCHGFRNTSRSVAEYLFDINDKLNKLKDTEEDVIEVVPLHILQQEEDFMSYVTRSNDRIGKQQCMGLTNIQYCVYDRNQVYPGQAEIKKECLELWNIREDIRKARPTSEHKQIFSEVWKKLNGIRPDKHVLEADGASFKPTTLTADNLPPDVYSWKWYYMCGSRYMLVGAGRSELKGWNQKGPLSFSSVSNASKLELPPQTVLDVDICEEFDSRGKKRFIMEVIDVLSISGEFVGDKPFPKRQELITKMCKAVNKLGNIQLRLKKCYRFVDIGTILANLEDISEGKLPQIVSYDDNDSYTQPQGIVLFQTTRNPWHLHFSNSSQRLYFYNGMTKKSAFEGPHDSIASYKDFLQSRMLWIWEPRNHIRAILGMTEDVSCLNEGKLTMTLVAEHVAKRMNK